MKTIAVEVTAADIERGIPAHCMWCPVARALMRLWPADLVTVGPFRVVRTPLTGEEEIWVMDEAAVRFVDGFDKGEEVQPASFVLTEVKRG